MAVYDRVDKRRRRTINAKKKYDEDIRICWRKGYLPKTTLIKMMVESFIWGIKIWLTTKLEKRLLR